MPMNLVLLSQTRKPNYRTSNIILSLLPYLQSSLNCSVIMFILHQIEGYKDIQKEFISPTLHVYTSPFLALSSSRNTCFSIASKEYGSSALYGFIDDDCILPDPHSILKILSLYEGDTFMLTCPILTADTKEPFNRHVFVPKHRLLLSRRHYRSFLGGAIFTTYSAFIEAGMFDISLGLGAFYGGSEDADLFLSAMNQSIPVYSEPSFYIFHPLHRPYQYSFSTMYKYGLGRGRALRNHLSSFPVFIVSFFIFEIISNFALAILSLLGINIYSFYRNFALFAGKLSGFSSCLPK